MDPEFEKALGGLAYPADKSALMAHAAPRVSKFSKVLGLIEALPTRTFRNEADLMAAFEALRASGADWPEPAQPRPERGTPARNEVLSAAEVARALRDIHFPSTRGQLVEYAKRHHEDIPDAGRLVALLERLPERRYRNIGEVEREAWRVPPRPS